MWTHLISLYQKQPRSTKQQQVQSMKLCSLHTSPHPSRPPSLFYARLSRSPLSPCFLSITLVSLQAVSPLSQSPTVTHSIIPTRFFSSPPLLLLLLSEALQTRRWLHHTMDPVFTRLFMCLQTGWRGINSSHAQRTLCCELKFARRLTKEWMNTPRSI